MSNAAKIWLIIAAVLMLLGGMLFVGGLTMNKWNFAEIGTETYETNTYEVGEAFANITIDVDTTEIAFLPAEGEECKVVCFENAKIKHSVTVENDTLLIDTVDTRKWYEHITFSFQTPKMTVYLPQKEYASLKIETDTGDITLPKDFSFETIQMEGDTSHVNCFASASGTVEVEVSTGTIRAEELTAGELKLFTSTGKINIKSVKVQKDITLETDTGRITLDEVPCKDLFATGNTGSITLKSVVATGRFSIENDTGSVVFEYSDASEIFVRTSTGNVTGTLLSEKVFITETSTGKVDVPKSTSGGRCEIVTSTGNIRIAVD